MNIREFSKDIELKILTGDKSLDKEVTGVYVCDLLSWVVSRAAKGNAWITVHTNINIVAVAVLAEVSCIIVPENIELEEATLIRAEQENIPILSSDLDSYHICSKISKACERIF